MRRPPLRLLAVVCLLAAVPAAGFVGRPDDDGYVGLGLLLRRLNTTGVFVQATAHPDDENNGLLVMFARGRGYRAALVSATRGDGGQNEIGPELSDALAVLRTGELEAVHAIDGAEQYFTRAIDFGYSFSVDETFEKWDRREILGDYVRHIRTIRPDVIATLAPGGGGGGQHHQAAAILTKDAFRAAGDPQQFPEQINGGLRPWQARKLYVTSAFGFRGAPPPQPGVRSVTVDATEYDALLGATYQELGSLARSMHKCQGMAQLLMLPGTAFTFRYALTDTTIPGQMDRDEVSLFDGVDTSIEGLAQFVAGSVPPVLSGGLSAVARHAREAQQVFNRDGLSASLPPIAAGLSAVRALRSTLATAAIDETARFEIDSRLRVKAEDFERAAVLASALRVEALADDGVVIGGQEVKATVLVGNRGRDAVDVRGVAFEGFEGAGASACEPAQVRAGGVFRCEASLRVPAEAVLTSPYWTRRPDAERYDFEAGAPFGHPFRPSPFRARVEMAIGGEAVTVAQPLEYRYEGNIFSGEKRMEIHVVPRFSVRLTPEIAIIPAADGAARTASENGRLERELRVTVVHGGRDASAGEVRLNLPDGWRSTPPSAAVSFTREDEAQTLRFRIEPPAAAPAGEYALRAAVDAAGRSFDRGYQVVEYPHVSRRHLIWPAQADISVIDVGIPEGLTVGYVMGVGDQVPPAIEQIGARLEFIDADGLAWGDLSRFDAIVTGVRAYERRADLRANNHRLIEYARAGGTVVVQYNKFEFNEAQYGPYPAEVSSNRVTDEHSPVAALAPDHPVFRFPNRLDERTWAGWVQERGLYFLGEKDPRYTDLVELTDPFENNPGPKRGALVEATVGKGRWVYVGLGLWRQLPAGTAGAYQILANLLSLGRAPVGAGTAAGGE